MKTLSFLLLIFASCTTYVPDFKDKTKRVDFSAQLGGWIAQDSGGIIFVKTTLHNNSADTINYLRMDCSWADSYTTDNDTFDVIKTPCYKNGPQTIKLLPFESNDEYIRLTTKKKIQDWRDSKLSVGYNFTLFDSTKNIIYNVSKLTDMQSIMWSDTLRLSKFWKK